MPEPAWQGWCAQLEAAPRPLQRHGELWEWLQHQRGLHALGWLPARRQRALAALQVRWASVGLQGGGATEHARGCLLTWSRSRLACFAQSQSPPILCTAPAINTPSVAAQPPAWRSSCPHHPCQVDLSTFDRSPEDSEWDRQLTQLLAFKAEHGHCRLPPAAAATDAAAAAAARRWAPLAAWLAEQHRCAAAARLPPPRAAQLAAIGAAPAAGAAAATPPPPPAAAATAQAG